jgi:hypothetical protein
MNLNTKKIKLINLLKESMLDEIFNTPPFKTDFEFKQNVDDIRTNSFLDSQNNDIEIIFHKIENGFYELDFTVNGSSYKNDDIKYSITEYASLLATVAKATSQFLKEFTPNGVKIDPVDSFEKTMKRQQREKNGSQKGNIYDYFINNLDFNSDYSMPYKNNGNFDLIKK